MKSAEKTILYIVYQHKLACERMEAWIRDTVPIIRPKLQIVLKVKKAAGFYCHRTHSCIYPLAFAIVGGATYRQTIYHEVVHGYQFQLLPNCTTHGELFKFLLNHVMGVTNRDRFHRYSVPHAQALSRLLQIQFSKQEINTLQEGCIRETSRIIQKT